MGCGHSQRQSFGPITSYKQYFEAIANGAQFVILEDDVIDLRTFADLHPGGKEILEKYVGIIFSFKCLPRNGN